jgi:UDP-N-acetylmuramoyl-tripeptide--D-alanyl-D-alanine ligase
MAPTLTRVLDWLERRVKPAAKATYRRPVTELARAWRHMLPRTCLIGVTGSAGKTATKDLLHAALAGRYRTTKSSDSDNQLYDIARTLLSSGPRTQFCVQEIGASEPGRFDPMLALLKPRVGVVTNIGTDHIKSFRSADRVAVEKAKLIESLPVEGIAVLNADDPLVAAMASNCRARVVTYGLQQQAQFRAESVTDTWPQRLALRIRHGNDAVLVQTRLLPGYQAGNVLAAIATACSLGLPLAEAALTLSVHEPPLGRMSVHSTARGVTFIRDDVKAPEWSLQKAIQYMGQAQAARKLIIIGTISDGGGRANIYRRAVEGALAAADHVLLVGERAAAAARRLDTGGGKLIAFATVQDAAHWLDGFARAGDLVLLKGSNRADHLARLALVIDHEVGCWRSRCPRNIVCDRCRLIRAPAAP